LINQILDVSEGPTVDGEMAHPVMKGAVLPRSGSLWILWEQSTRTPDLRLVFDGVKHMVDRNPEWNKVRLCSVILVRLVCMLRWFMDSGRFVDWVLPRGGCCFGFSSSDPCLGAIGRTSSRLFDLHVLLRLDKNISHLGDIVLHQMLVEQVDDLQPTDEYSGGYVFIAIVYQSHLAMKIIDVVLQALPWFHPNLEEMIVVPLELSLKSELIVECVSYIIETPKRVLQK